MKRKTKKSAPPERKRRTIQTREGGTRTVEPAGRTVDDEQPAPEAPNDE